MGLTAVARTAVVRLKRENKPLRFLLSRFLWQTGLSRALTIRFHDGFKIRFHPSAMAASLWLDSNYNVQDRQFLRRYLENGDVVVDVGANIGALSIVAGAHVGREGHVYSFEPHPIIYRYLCDNLALNALHNVTAINCALAAASATLNLSDSRSDDQNVIVAASAVQVPARRLDDIISASSHVALLKIDVEGYEYFVLQGARETLSRTSCVYLELSEENFRRFGYELGHVVALLTEVGLTLYGTDGELTDLASLAKTGGNAVAIRNMDDFRRRTRATHGLVGDGRTEAE